MSAGLVSIGYEGRTALELIATLSQLGVSVLVDVRLTPLSRKPGLSKTKLGLAAAEAGIRYVHLPALGTRGRIGSRSGPGRWRPGASASRLFWPAPTRSQRWTSSKP